MWSKDRGMYSYSVLEKVVSTKTFIKAHYNKNDFNKYIDTEKAFIGIIFPEKFSQNIFFAKKNGNSNNN